MTFKITPNALGWQWFISICLVDGEHRQDFVVRGENSGSKLENFIEARKNMKYLLKDIEKHIVFKQMVEIVYENNQDVIGKPKRRCLTENWRIE